MQPIEELSADRLGSLGTRVDGERFVRFERDLPVSAVRVWQLLTDPVALDRWFPGFELDARHGGSFSIWFDADCDGPAHVTGVMTVFDAPSHPPSGPPNQPQPAHARRAILQCGSMRYELLPSGISGLDADGCQLVFTDVLNFAGSLSEAEVINSVLGGWHRYLDALECALLGGSKDPHAEPEYDYSRIDVAGR